MATGKEGFYTHTAQEALEALSFSVEKPGSEKNTRKFSRGIVTPTGKVIIPPDHGTKHYYNQEVPVELYSGEATFVPLKDKKNVQRGFKLNK